MESCYEIVFDSIMFFIRFWYEVVLGIIGVFLPTALKELSGEIVWISGTGHGIGKRLARLYVEQGCKVVCVDINEKNNNQTVKELNSIRPKCAFGYKCDVTNRDEVFELANKVKKEVGTVTVLVNNAGIMPTHPLDQQTPTEIRTTIDLNIVSHFWTLQAFMPGMIAAGKGHVIALSSMAGQMGFTHLVPYCATKFAVRGLMEAMEAEVRDLHPNAKINFTTICPYMVDTGLCKVPFIRFPKLFAMLKPEEVADAILYAHRANKREVTVPSFYLRLGHIAKFLPYESVWLIKKFINAGVDSDLKAQ